MLRCEIRRLARRPWATATPAGSAVLSFPTRRVSSVPTHRAPPAGVPAAAASHTFWRNTVPYVPPTDIKKKYAFARAVDKRSRFTVRQHLREDGIVSNLYEVVLPPASEKTLYVYEMYATRTLPKRDEASSKATPALKAPQQKTADKEKPKSGGDGGGQEAAAAVRRVGPQRLWRAVRRSFQRRFAVLPPLVQVDYTIYAAAPLPAEALQVPKEFHDLGWNCCELRLRERTSYAALPPHELQQLVNKMIMWAAHQRSRAGGKQKAFSSYQVVREYTGKVVCTDMGLSSNGLRVYKGTVMNCLFIHPGELEPATPQAARATRAVPAGRPITTSDLAEVEVGVTPAEGPPLRFKVHAFIRAFTYKGKQVESYKVEDASGVYLASLWEPATSPALQVGELYAATRVKVRQFPEKNNLRLFEFTEGTVSKVAESTSSSTTTTTPPEDAAKQKRQEVEDGAAASKQKAEAKTQKKQEKGDADEEPLPGLLCVKIDTKGTIASETSLWDEVKQHFGPGPYSEEAQENIARSIQGTPVIVSHTMQQSIIRLVRFEELMAEKGAAVRTNESLRELLPYLEPHQPLAVFPDYSTHPLQTLHCCFDPRMKSWQDISVSTLSVMPEERMQMINTFAQNMQEDFGTWGVKLCAEPLRTKALALLPTPSKAIVSRSPAQRLRHPPPPPYPTTLAVVGLTKSRSSAEENKRTTLTAQQMAQYFRTNLVACVSDEAEVVRYMVEHLLLASPSGGPPQLRDPNSGLILVTGDRELRATRWIMAEALSRGVLPVVVPPAGTPKRVSLLCGNVKRQLSVKFEVNPLRGVDLAQDVPVLARKRTLIVGIDTCHTNVQSTGAIVGILATPERHHLLPIFWRQEARGRETQHVAQHFRQILHQAVALYDGLDEIIVFQDGDVFSELHAMKEEITAVLPTCGLTFMCLHKRTNTRFVHNGEARVQQTDDRNHQNIKTYNNIVKGVVVPALAPVALDYEVAAPSFYLQTHESNMSTARIVQYSVHHTSPTLDVTDVQQVANVLANILAPQATKLPMSTRCAHRLADAAERLLDAVPQLESHMLPSPLNQRLWFM